MYYALFVINKLLTSVCNINHCFSSVQEIIYCIVYLFCFGMFFLNHWMGEILENVFNSVIDKLNFILQPFLCLLVCWLPKDCQVRLLRQVCQYYSSLTGRYISVSLWQRHLQSKWRRSWIYTPFFFFFLKCSCSVVAHAGALLHVNKCLWNWVESFVNLEH